MRAWLKRLAVILVWLVIWQALSLIVNNDILLSGPIEIVGVLVKNAAQPAFWLTVALSGARIMCGFAFAFILGIVTGATAARFGGFALFVEPPIQFMKSVPIVCFIVLLLVGFGALYTSTIAVFLVAYPAIHSSCVEALRNRNRHLSELLRVFRMARLRRAFVFYWPTMLPFLLASSRVAVGMSWKAGVAAELIGLPLGSIGERIYQAKIGLSSADIFAWTVVVVLISLACERLLVWLLGRSEDWLWGLALPRPGALDEQVSRGSAVAVEGVSKSFTSNPVLQSVSYVLEAGGCYALSSPSGSGKTTLLYLLAGLISPDAGHITKGVATTMEFQEARLFEKHNAVENIQMLTGAHCDRRRAEEALLRVLPSEALTLPVEQLSGGMRRRVELCRALVAPSQLVLLDEPFTGLDATSKAVATQLLLDELGGRTLVIATHDPEDIERLGLQTIPWPASTQ